MTRNLTHVVSAGLVLSAALIAAPLFGQSTQTKPKSSYGAQAPRGTAPSTGQPGPPKVYGPAAPPRQPAGGGVRPVAGEEPVREPAPGAAGTKRPPVGPVMGPFEQPAAPRPPSWYPLDSESEDWLNKVLVAWEKTSEGIVAYQCKFQRWDYDPAALAGPGISNPRTPNMYAKGVIKYARPDKGLFKVEELQKYVAPAKPGEKAKFVKEAAELNEHWVCDGKSITQLDHVRRLVVQQILPKEMWGKAIADGPLPFLFGAKVETIKARYWIRPIDPPKDREEEYWLEAVPKDRRDAMNFQKVTVILSKKDFLPQAIDVYKPNFDKVRNPAHTEYEFTEREPKFKKDSALFDPFKFFVGNDFQPKVPFGWKKTVEDLGAPPPQAVEGPNPAEAKRPGAGKTK